MGTLPISLWQSPWPERVCHTSPRLFLCLDYDATLASHAACSGNTTLTSDVLTLLSRLVQHPYYSVALVSGRSLEDLRRRVPLEGASYIGTHGCEVCTPQGEAHLLIPGGVVAMAVSRLRQDLTAVLREVPDLILEDKRYALALHYCDARPQDEWAVEAFLSAVRRYQRKGITLEIVHGKKMVEARPVGSNKGKAIRFLLSGEPVSTLPMYFGGLLTDEDAFTTLAGHGITVVVADPPRPSAAQYCVRNSQEVVRFLSLLLKTQ
ncbi:MAG: trehalose-phosphatase [Candidatus Binatia bacterium]